MYIYMECVIYGIYLYIYMCGIYKECIRNIQIMFRCFGGSSMFFGLLETKPCRIIMSFRQNTIFGPETCQIKPKLSLRPCPELLLTP